MCGRSKRLYVEAGGVEDQGSCMDCNKSAQYKPTNEDTATAIVNEFREFIDNDVVASMIAERIAEALDSKR